MSDFSSLDALLTSRSKYFRKGAEALRTLATDPALVASGLGTQAAGWASIAKRYDTLKRTGGASAAAALIVVDAFGAACTLSETLQALRDAGISAPSTGVGDPSRQGLFGDVLYDPTLCAKPFEKGYPKVFFSNQLDTKRARLNPYSSEARTLLFVRDAAPAEAYVAVAPNLFAPYPMKSTMTGMWSAVDGDWFGSCEAFWKWAPILGHPMSGAGLCIDV